MSSRRATAAKVLLVMFLIFSPYFALILWVSITYGNHPPRWFALLGLIYMIGGIWTCIFLTRKMFNKQLSALSPEVVEHSQQTYARSDFPPLTIEVVYISSVGHLERLQSLPWYAKQLGLNLRGFPTVSVGSRSYPLVYFASGEVLLTPTEFQFSPRASVDTSKSYSNLNTDLQFQILPGEILSVNRFDMRQVTSAPVRLPFIRIQTTEGRLRDFLICSGSDDLSEIASETEGLFAALESFVENGKAAEVRS